MLTGAIPVQAATQEVQGNSSQTKNVPVTASITSVYSVSLPASISLAYGFETDDADVENCVKTGKYRGSRPETGYCHERGRWRGK